MISIIIINILVSTQLGLFFEISQINSIFFLLVVAGNTHRYASTHRVSRCEGHTFQYIQKKAQNILNQVSIFTPCQ